MLFNNIRPWPIPFFMADGAGGSGGSEGPEGEEGGEGGSNTGGKSGKTFTQEEVNRMLKAEKESAKKSLLKELGVDDAKTAKEGLEKYREIQDKNKTDAEKAKDDLAAETKAKGEAEKRAILAEAKVEVLSAGCNPEYLEDVITLALKRVSDDKDLPTVVKEMKEDQKYKAFFTLGGSGSEDHGTGGGSGYRRKQDSDKKGSLGSRLGEQVVKSTVKNPYFNN